MYRLDHSKWEGYCLQEFLLSCNTWNKLFVAQEETMWKVRPNSKCKPVLESPPMHTAWDMQRSCEEIYYLCQILN